MSDRPEKLEAFVSHLARSQPLRRAPATLSQRVLAQVAQANGSLQQANLPWWRKGFAQWPLPARVAFLVASYGFVRLALTGVTSAMSFVGSREAAGTAVTWAHSGKEALAVTAEAASALIHAIPPSWLYGAIAVGFVLYAALFGLGTVAYRTLYVER
jgi:hypothetical protein